MSAKSFTETEFKLLFIHFLRFFYTHLCLLFYIQRKKVDFSCLVQLNVVLVRIAYKNLNFYVPNVKLASIQFGLLCLKQFIIAKKKSKRKHIYMYFIPLQFWWSKWYCFPTNMYIEFVIWILCNSYDGYTIIWYNENIIRWFSAHLCCAYMDGPFNKIVPLLLFVVQTNFSLDEATELSTEKKKRRMSEGK